MSSIGFNVLDREYAYKIFAWKVYLLDREREFSWAMCMIKHTRGFQSFDINDNEVLLAYFQMCSSTLCNMQENLKNSWRAGSFHSPNQVKWHCIKGLFSFIKLKVASRTFVFQRKVKIQTQDRKRVSERERMENYRAGAIMLLVIFIFPALVECKVRLYDFRVSAHSLLRSYGSPLLATDKGCCRHFW